MHQIQPQGMGLLFEQAYPAFFQQPGMGGYPIPQMPNMMGGMYSAPPQMWIQLPIAPVQPSSMDVDDDASQSTEPKSSSTTKKGKGKKKASEAFMHHQEVQEVEESLVQVLQCVEEAGLDPELARLAIDSNTTQMLVENLLTHLDILRNELRQSEWARIRDEDEKMRLRDKILHLKNDDRWCDDSSQYTMDNEKCYRKKRKEWESDRPLYDDYDERDSRRPPSRPSDNIRKLHKRSIRPLPSQPLLRHPSQHVLPQGAPGRRGRETPPPHHRSSSRQDKETPPPQTSLSMQRDREIPPPQSKPPHQVFGRGLV